MELSNEAKQLGIGQPGPSYLNLTGKPCVHSQFQTRIATGSADQLWIPTNSKHRNSKRFESIGKSQHYQANRHAQEGKSIPCFKLSPRTAHLVPVVPVAGGAGDEHGPLRPHFILLNRRSSSVTPLLRRHLYQRLPLTLRPIRRRRRRGGEGQEREESTQPCRSCHHRSRGGASDTESSRVVGARE